MGILRIIDKKNAQIGLNWYPNLFQLGFGICIKPHIANYLLMITFDFGFISIYINLFYKKDDVL